MKDFSEVNFFTDPGLVANPYPYYEYLRAQCPVVHVPSSGVVAVTGYDELGQVYRDSATFSAVNSSLGPFPLPFEVAGDDISEQVEAHRDRFPMSEHLVSFDRPNTPRTAPCSTASSRQSDSRRTKSSCGASPTD